MAKQRYKLINHDTKLHVCKQVMAADWGKVVTIEDPTRSLEANARFHAMLHDISKQADYMGKKRTVEFWKALFVSGWMVATDQKPEMIPGLEGEYLLLRESTATMTGKRLSSCMEYVSAWAAQSDIRFTASEWEYT
jgi:hypothetical protein